MKKRKFITSILVSIMVLSLFLISACGDNQDASSDKNSNTKDDVIVLKVADNLTEQHFLYTMVIGPWMERVTELTDGKVEFEYYNNEQLGDSREMHNMLKTGIADIGYLIYSQDTIPLMEIMQLPGLYENGKQGTYAWSEFTKNYMTDNGYFEDVGIKPVISVASTPYILLTNKKITSVSDLKGAKLRSSGGPNDLTVNHLGGSPVGITSAEFLQAMEKNVVDGAIATWGQVEGFQWASVSEYFTTNLSLNGYGILFGMNDKVYQDLPEDVQKSMNQATEEVEKSFAEEVDQEDDRVKERLKEEYDSTLYEIPESELEGFHNILEDVTGEWIEKKEKDGHSAQEALEELQKIIEKY